MGDAGDRGEPVTVGEMLADERRHPPAGRTWEERWWFDFVALPEVSPEASPRRPWGGYVRLAFRWEHDRQVAWYWAAMVGTEHGLVAVRADDLRVPARGTEVRGDGVWAALTCETPGDHWSLGLECFGAAFEDDLEAWGAERGDVVPFGLDLEWEATGPIVAYANHGYDQWCEVHGEVLIGDDRLPVAGLGSREHAWGAPQTPPSFRAAIAGRPVAHRESSASVAWTPFPERAAVDDLEVRPVQVSPVAVPDARVVNALCRSEDGFGWVSWWE